MQLSLKAEVCALLVTAGCPGYSPQGPLDFDPEQFEDCVFEYENPGPVGCAPYTSEIERFWNGPSSSATAPRGNLKVTAALGLVLLLGAMAS